MTLFRTVAEITDPSLGGSGTNTWHVRTTALMSDPTIIAELAGLREIINDFYVELADVISGAATIRLNGEWIEIGVEEPEAKITGPQEVVYSGSEDVLPPANCMVTSWRTSSPTRRGRGRTFLGPLKSSVLQSNGTPTEAARGFVLAAAENLVESSDSFGNGAIGVWSQAGAGSPWEGTFRDFTGVSVSNKFASLRSRRD